MSFDRGKLYPGALATPQQIALLADEYRMAAEHLLVSGPGCDRLSRYPYRLLAIHAIELYLNAYLLAAGHPASALRGLHHNFSSRTELVTEARLALRKRTLEHLRSLSETREYLVARYDPVAVKASELNRMAATLTEVSRKVTQHLATVKSSG